ncbi:MAG: hypothetical protein GY898_05405 [Proteobacteria bacterium]|nr:hypothetical protein [Pseudomonadota bacterium]
MIARPRLLLVVLCIVFGASAAFVNPMGIAGRDEFRNNDWLNCRSFDVLTRRALLEDGEWPLRTHLLGGGFPVAAHPSDGSWAPTIIAVLLFGDVVGVKLNLLLFLIVGSLGMHAIARRWLGLSEEAALIAGALFAVSGWLPSMWLVGFYNQLFYLLCPAIFFLFVSSGEEPRDRGLMKVLLGALLLAFVLQQGGHAFPAIVFFLGVTAWGLAAMESAMEEAGALRTWGLPLVVLLGCTSALAFAKELSMPWLIAVAGLAAAAVVAGVPRMRRFGRALLPWGGRLALLLAICCSLGAARLAGIGILEGPDGKYEHRLQRRDALWFPDPADSPIATEERFYNTLPDFLQTLSGRVPADTDYTISWGRQGDPTEYEYAWLGLTPPFVLLMFAGLVFAVRRDRKGQLIAGLGVLFSLISFGWRAPPDFHFLMTWGVPRLDSFAQPIKYWNFFILLSGVLLAALAVDSLPRRKLAVPAVALLLLWPFAQNRATLAELFEFERPAEAEADAFHQMAMVAEEWWVERSDAQIRAMSDQLHLRDFVRPRTATEYFNLRRGVGTADHYGSIVLAEYAIPATYTTLEGRAISNPRYRGEAWLGDGRGSVLRADIGHNRIQLDVQLESTSTVMVNQNHLPGFSTDVGQLTAPVDGLLSVEAPAGSHTITLTYRPRTLVRGFLVSGLSFVGWVIAMAVLLRRRVR